MDPKDELPIHMISDGRFKILITKHFELIKETISEQKTPVVVFDSLRRIHDGDENSSKDMAPVMAKLRELVDLGVTVIVIHHATKGNGGEARYKTRGSGDIPAACDIEYIVDTDKPNSGKVRWQVGATREKPMCPQSLSIMDDPDGITRVYNDGAIVSQKAANKQKVLELLKSHKDIDYEMVEEGLCMSRTTARKLIQGMVNKKIIKQCSGEKGKKNFKLSTEKSLVGS